MKPLSTRECFRYGAFGLPLSLVALPIYVYVPQFYAVQFGLPLTLIGTALLAARFLDAFLDPLIGNWLDRSHASNRYARFILLAVPLLLIGFLALFHPPTFVRTQAMPWLLASLLVVYTGFSLATIAYHSWGATLTQAQEERSKLTAMREGLGLLGVMLAAALAGASAVTTLTLLFVVSLLVGAGILLRQAPRPHAVEAATHNWRTVLIPLRNPHFRWLFAVFLLNGIAAAIPATLFLFFVDDRLHLGTHAGAFLMLYFAAAAASMPLWSRLARRHGEARIWLAAMLLSIAAFIWAYGLTAGTILPFGLICLLSGIALGADLALPPALLAGVIRSAGHSGRHDGAYFGIWNWATKINLALAAGIALPLLERLGYRAGTTDEPGVQALSIAYALLPCLLKSLAALVLWRAPLRHV